MWCHMRSKGRAHPGPTAEDWIAGIALALAALALVTIVTGLGG